MDYFEKRFTEIKDGIEQLIALTENEKSKQFLRSDIEYLERTEKYLGNSIKWLEEKENIKLIKEE